MTITAAQVKELRERTGGAMMDCKKALQETNGDMEKAVEFMRKAGLAKAAKKAGRVAAEGLIIIAISADSKQAAIIEVNCETDFVARDTHFKQFCELLGEVALAQRTTELSQLLAASVDDDTVDALRQRLVVTIGENINVRRCHFISSEQGVLGHYIHGGRIGVLVDVSDDDVELAKDIAMHIAASNPECVKPDDVNSARVDAEKAILIAQAQESGKPSEIIEKMIKGRLQKFVNEISLYGQAFVKNPDMTVGKLVSGANAEVIQFVRYEVGEGIDKQQVDFAAEVMAQVQGE